MVTRVTMFQGCRRQIGSRGVRVEGYGSLLFSANGASSSLAAWGNAPGNRIHHNRALKARPQRDRRDLQRRVESRFQRLGGSRSPSAMLIFAASPPLFYHLSFPNRCKQRLGPRATRCNRVAKTSAFPNRVWAREPRRSPLPIS